MTNPPLVAPVVTDEMVEAAISAHTRNEIENWGAEGWKPSDAMRAAITAALAALQGDAP